MPMTLDQVAANDALVGYATVALAVVTGVLTVATIVLVFFAWRDLRDRLEDTRHQYHYQRMQATLDVSRSWTIESREHWRKLREELSTEEDSDIAQQLGSAELPDELRLIVLKILEPMEHIATGVQLRAYDINTVWHVARFHITKVRDDLDPYLTQIHKKQQSAYEHFVWLADTLRKMKEPPPPPPPPVEPRGALPEIPEPKRTRRRRRKA